MTPQGETVHITVGTEARFTRGPDGVIRSDTGGRNYKFWKRYLEPFCDVTVVARVVATADVEGSPVTGPSVTVSALDNFVGLRGWTRHLLDNRSRVRSICNRPDMAYLVRVPGLVGSMMIAALRDQRKPYGLEVVGDPYEVLRSGVVPVPFATVLGAASARQMRQQCGSAAAASYVTKEQLQSKYPAKQARFITHYSSVDLPPSAFVKAPKVSTTGRAVLVSVGGQSQTYKGQDVLIQAVAQLTQRGVALQLRLVGDGRLNPDLRQLARELSVSDQVTFVGRVASGAGVRAEIDKGDLFVLPSRTEGLPRALIEAMARGMPCIASAVGGVPELLPTQEMVPPGDPRALATLIEGILTSPEQRLRMAVRNLKTAQEYSDAVLADRRHEFYSRLQEITVSKFLGGE